MVQKRARLGLGRLALVGIAAAIVTGCTATRDFHGDAPDQAFPEDVKLEVDTRSTVLARLGTPSTTSMSDALTTAMSAPGKERRRAQHALRPANYRPLTTPKTVQRSIIADPVRPDDVVSDVLIDERG